MDKIFWLYWIAEVKKFLKILASVAPVSCRPVSFIKTCIAKVEPILFTIPTIK